MISPILPLIAGEFHQEAGQIGGQLGTSYALAAGASALVIGPLSDRFGRRKFLLYASITFGLSLLAVPFVQTARTLALARLFTGLAAGTFSTCSTAYVGDYFPYERRGMAMSIVQSGYFLAFVVGIPVATVVAQWQGWRVSFASFGASSVLVFALVLLFLPDDRPVTDSQQVRPEMKPRSYRVIFATKERLASIAAAFCVSCGFVGFLFYLGTWLTNSFNLQPRTIGYIFIAVGFVSLISAFVAGALADQFGKRFISLISTLVLAVMVFIIPKLAFGVLLIVCFLLAALAFAFRQGPVQALATELVPTQSRGALVAVRNTASQIGVAISTWASGKLYDDYGYMAVGIFCAVVSLAAGLFILMMKEPKKEV